MTPRPCESAITTVMLPSRSCAQEPSRADDNKVVFVSLRLWVGLGMTPYSPWTSMAVTGAQDTKPNPVFLIPCPGHSHRHAIGQSKSHDRTYLHCDRKVASRDQGCGCKIPLVGVQNWDNDPVGLSGYAAATKISEQWSGVSDTLG